MATRRLTAQSERLQGVRDAYWPDADPWTGAREIDDGWFKAPRTLPLILSLIRDKNLTPKGDPTAVYLELLSRQFNDGVVEIQNESDHAFAAGYTTTRAHRTWAEHMRQLEQLGFIKIQKVGTNPFKYVLIVHPSTAVHHLQQQGKVPESWFEVYRDRCITIKELSYEQRQELRRRSKVQVIDRAG